MHRPDAESGVFLIFQKKQIGTPGMKNRIRISSNGVAVETNQTTEPALPINGLRINTQDRGDIAKRRHWCEFYQEQAATVSAVVNMHFVLDQQDGTMPVLKLR